MENEFQPIHTEQYGKIEIAPEVIEVIANMATLQVEGVVDLSGGMMVDLVDRIGGRKTSGKGVKVDIGEKEAAVDVYIIVEYGNRIPDTAHKVQENVRNSIEKMTGMYVTKVNVHIVDVQLKQEKKESIEETHRVR
ncbi:MAG TPA: Asp23/Gls24 family envelope stress response protein [Paenibacillaceae bacterium]|nr:Asp23/Gls24 family envelope stress response protein [Paenibacillaceae bacterium]